MGENSSSNDLHIIFTVVIKVSLKIYDIFRLQELFFGQGGSTCTLCYDLWLLVSFCQSVHLGPLVKTATAHAVSTVGDLTTRVTLLMECVSWAVNQDTKCHYVSKVLYIGPILSRDYFVRIAIA